MDNPLGGIKRGWDEIKSVYETLFDSKPSTGSSFTTTRCTKQDDLFYVVGREKGELASSGRPLELAIRTTRVFRRDEDGRMAASPPSRLDRRSAACSPRIRMRSCARAAQPIVTQAGA